MRLSPNLRVSKGASREEATTLKGFPSNKMSLSYDVCSLRAERHEFDWKYRDFFLFRMKMMIGVLVRFCEAPTGWECLISSFVLSPRCASQTTHAQPGSLSQTMCDFQYKFGVSKSLCGELLFFYTFHNFQFEVSKSLCEELSFLHIYHNFNLTFEELWNHAISGSCYCIISVRFLMSIWLLRYSISVSFNYKNRHFYNV